MDYMSMVESLKSVKQMLESVDPAQFNMNHWWLDTGEAFDDDRNVMYKVADGPCGCVIGHLIQRGLLEGSVIVPSSVPDGSLPYMYRDRVWVQISDALKLYNYEIAIWLFSQYAYNKHPISKEDVVRRIDFCISEIQH
jgi:hypothetical protein